MKPVFKIRPSSANELLGVVKETRTEKIETLNEYLKTPIIGKEGQVQYAKDLEKREKYKKQIVDLKKEPDAFNHLPDGLKTHCQKWIKKTYFDYEPILMTPAILKGIEVEDESLQEVSRVLFNNEPLVKNKERIDDDYFSGEYDFKIDRLSLVADLKNSETLASHPIFNDSIDNRANEVQVNVYRHLLGFENCAIIKCLMDCTIDFIQNKIFYAQNRISNQDFNVFDDNAAWEVAKEYIYTEKGVEKFLQQYPKAFTFDFKPVPDHLRFLRFDVPKDDEEIKKLQERVLMSREYIDYLIKKYIKK